MIYFIHLKQDIGRLHWINNFISKINGKIWNGVFAMPIDKNGYILNTISPEEGTQCAKQAKINLFEHYLSTSKEPYLIVFEDDIIWHTNFFNLWKELNVIIKNNIDWKLLYLGVSSNLEMKPNNELHIRNLPTDKIYTGAYSFIIKREMVKIALERAKDMMLKYKPFDVTCLGYLQQKYSKQCFITNPQLILADVSGSNIRHNRKQEIFNKNMGWNINDYYLPNKIPFVIICNNNRIKLKRTIKLCGYYFPLIQPIIIHMEKNTTAEILKELDNFKLKGIPHINIKNNYIDSLVKILQNLDCKYYVLTNTNISWSVNEDINIFNIANDLLQTFDVIKFNTNLCKKCNVNVLMHNNKIYQNMCIIKKNINILTNTNIYKLNMSHYTTAYCNDISINDFHTITINDIYEELLCDLDFFNIYGKYHKLNEKDWINLFSKWVVFYFDKSLKNILELKTLSNEQNIDIKQIKKFTDTKFKLLRFMTKNENKCIIVYLNAQTLKNIFGTLCFSKIKKLYKKHNISFPYKCVKFVYKY